MSTSTILASLPSHPLDNVLQRLFNEQFDLIAKKAAEWRESKVSMWCWIAAQLSEKTDKDAFKQMASVIGMWAIEAYKKRDSHALNRLAKCWENGGFEGIPTIAGSTQKKGRKDLVKCRNLVMFRLMSEARESGTPFCDSSIRAYAKLYCGISQLSDETVKAWRDFIGPEGLTYHISRKRGPRKGSTQTLRNSRIKTGNPKQEIKRKPDK